MAEPKKKKPTLRKASKAAKPKKADDRARPSSQEEGASSVKDPSPSEAAPKPEAHAAQTAALKPETPTAQTAPSPFVSGEDAYGEEAMAKREEASRAAKKAEKRDARAQAKRARKSEKASRPKRKVAYTPKQILTFVILALLAALVIIVAAFSWNRWLRYDDAADFQGVWNYADGTVQVTIDGEEIRLTEDAAYAYELDTFSKSITLTFGDLSGQGVYEFSEDRSVLVIVDGRTPDLASILGLADIAEGAGDALTKLVRTGDLPAEDPAVSAQSPSAQDGSSQETSSGSSSEDASAGSSSSEDASAGSSSSDGSDSGSSEPSSEDGQGAQGNTGQSVDSLGSDPEAGAGSNVVTPEELGVSVDSLSSG